MLKKMYIKNYVLIDEAEIVFSSGYQVITGETGAGKSLMLDAFLLSIGGRFNRKALLYDDKKCVIEATFDVQHNRRVLDILHALDVDVENELIIRRECSARSRMRSFINDTPCKLEHIQKITLPLVDLHRQLDHLHLFHSSFELEVLDSVAGIQGDYECYKSLFQDLHALEKEADQLKQTIQQEEKDRDYNVYLLEEIEALQLHPEEVMKMEEEQAKMQHAESILRELQLLRATLEQEDSSITSTLAEHIKQLNLYKNVHKNLTELVGRLQSVQIELRDIASTTLRLEAYFDVDMYAFEGHQEQLSALYTLLKKHRLQTAEDLFAYAEELRTKLSAQESKQNQLEHILYESKKLKEELHLQAIEMSKRRETVIPDIEKRMTALLAEVGMERATWKIEQRVSEELTLQGLDSIQFLIDVNGIGLPQAVTKVASGGEISRIMLSLKMILSEYGNLTVMVFDEIDVGISGEVANKVGKLLAILGQKKQLICITHQASIAAAATTHFGVFKRAVGESMKTSIQQLDQKQRIKMLAQMIGGSMPSELSLQHAREMIMQRET